MKKYFPLFLFLLLNAACHQPASRSKTVANKFSDETLRQLYTFQDERNTAQLLPYFKNANAEYRKAAALAFASVQDKNALPELNMLLSDPEAPVRQAAAYAIGQTFNSISETALLAAIDKEPNPFTRAEMFEALGKIATEKGLTVLTNFDTSDTVTQAGQAWGLYRAILRNPLPETSIAKAVAFISKDHAFNTRLAAAQLLARSGKTNLSSYLPALKNSALSELHAPVRSAVVSALGKANLPAATEILAQLAISDPDYRVRLSAIRALTNHNYATYRATVLKALNDQNPNVRLTAAELLATKSLEETKTYREAANQQADWRTRAILFGAALKTNKDAKSTESLRQEVVNQYQQSNNIYEKGALLSALGNDPYAYTFLEKETFAAKNPVISTYGIEALANLRKSPDFPENQKPQFAEMMKRAVDSPDVAVVGSAAGLLREPELNFRQAFPDFEFLRTAQAKLTLPRDIEPYMELQKTIAFFEQKPTPEPPKNPLAHPINWQLVQTIPANQKVLLKTDKGNITLKLLVEDAPGSVANFVELVNHGFYNNKYFHRVVPNFVAQGGDPRGDGWGGTDYTIRSEFADLHYVEGSVGLASAGKDTESCQWFITHNIVPHLDGRYTIFAQVVAGMAIVHQLQIGDKIESIELMH